MLTINCSVSLLCVGIIFCLIHTSIATPVYSKTTSIQLVHVFFRHGERTPDKKDFYPTDPYKDYTFYPEGLGQLTNIGKLREYNLGKMLRERYNSFLGDVYVPDILSATSTDYDRTKMSLLLVLAGMWPPNKVQQWHPDFMWQPIPFNYKNATYDHLIQRPNSYCPKYLAELNRVISSEDVQEFILDHEDVFKYVEKWTGKSMQIPIDMFNVYQNLNAEASMNLTLPDWTKSTYPEPLQTIAGMQCLFENYNDLLIRLNGGHHLKLLINKGQAKINNELKPEGRKIYLISGHENNVLNILSALDLFTPHVPTYGSAVILELHKLDGTEQYGYQIFYHNQTGNDPHLLTMPGCTEFCPFDEFIALTAKYVPNNYTAECESNINLD